jgi:glycosyltransferase involved in cell wall biosynthesis
MEQVEVIIPCYNHAAFLPDAFASVQRQSTFFRKTRVTFVDDASTDGSLGVIRELVRDAVLQTHVLSNDENLGQGTSINRAVAASTSELFVILNADDMLVQECFEITKHAYEARLSIFMLGAPSVWFDEPGDLRPDDNPQGSFQVNVVYPTSAMRFQHVNDLQMTHSSSSFFRAAWSLVGGYRPLRERVCSHDDRDFQLRVASALPVGLVDRPLAYYRIGSSQGRGRL